MKKSSEQRYRFKSGRYSSHSQILRLIGRGTGRVLDVGCAEGYLAKQLTTLGWYVVGIENDPSSASRAQTACDRVILADLNKINPQLLIEEPFDVVVCGDVLEHLVDPLTVLTDLKGNLNPGGQLICSVPNVAHLWIRLNLLLGRFTYADRGIMDRTHLRFFTRRSLIRLLTDAGLAVRSVRTAPVPIEEVIPAAHRGRGLWWLQSVGALFSTLLPTLFAYQFIVVAEIPPQQPQEPL